MRSVVTAGNVTRVQTWRLPVILPPGTVAHALPVQYRTWKSMIPYALNVVLSVGSTGLVYASCTLKTSISVIVFGPLNAICTHSGNPFGPALFQYPPAPTS